MSQDTIRVNFSSRRFVYSLLALVALASLMAITASPVWAAPGDLDTSFDGDGIVTTVFGGSIITGAEGVAIQSDGKIVIAGDIRTLTDNFNFALARYNVDGSLDTSFDGDGKVTTDFGGGEIATAVAIQSDGKIVAAGSSDFGGPFDFALAVCIECGVQATISVVASQCEINGSPEV